MRVSRRQLAVGAFAVLVLAGEVAGRWLAARLPLVGHAQERHGGGADAWPVMVILAKAGMALLLARLAWRVCRAHRLACVGETVLQAVGHRRSRPAPSIGLSPRAWLTSFSAMAFLYIVPTSSAEVMNGSWPVLEPWLHTQALPVFALLAVAVAIAWRTVSCWLADFERYADEMQALVCRWLPLSDLARRFIQVFASPRSRFGVSFDSRPPPAPA